MEATGQGADAKLWFFSQRAGFSGRAINDANNSATNWLQVTRSGTTISNVVFPNGNVGIWTTAPLSTLSVGGTGVSGAAIYGKGGVYGVYSDSAQGYGVYSDSAQGYGVYSYSGSNVGVYGYSGGNVGVYGYSNAGAGGVGVFGADGNGHGVEGDAVGAQSVGVYGAATTGIEGVGTSYGGFFTGDTGVYTSSCPSCSVLAEMVPVAETPANGDIMCTDPSTGNIDVCTEDKSDYIKGIAQKYAENIMRMGCNDTLLTASSSKAIR